jgi:NTE family protein
MKNWKEWFQKGLRRVREFEEPPAAPAMRLPRLGLALGGGFARGVAHIGVLRVLEQEGIQISCIAGTSVGGLIATAYASGAPVDAIGQRACKTTFRDFARWHLSRYGLATNDRLDRYLYEFCGKRRIEELKIPLAIPATDLMTGEPVYFTSGETGQALRASCAYPGLFEPVEMDGRVLVDGFVSAPVPVDAARDLGAEVIIAVYLGMGVQTEKPRHMGEILWRAFSIMQNNSLCNLPDRCDVLIQPDVSAFAWDDFSRGNELAAKGAEATREALPEIKRLLVPRAFPATAQDQRYAKMELARPLPLPQTSVH